jgi:O-antigen/teichoic acid export membrane protein
MLRNMAIVAFANYVESAIGLLAGIAIARTMGPVEYGHYAYLIWLCGVLVMLTNSALTTSSIKFLAELRGAQRLDLAHILVFKLLRWQSYSCLAVLSCFLVFSVMQPMSELQGNWVPMMLIIAVAVWARAGFWLMGALGKGFEWFAPENLTLVMTAMLNLVFTAVLAWQRAPTIWFFASYAVLGVASNLSVRWMLKSSGLVSLQGDLPPDLFVRVRRHLVLTGILISLYALANRAVEMTLLKRYAGPAAVAYFSIAGALSKGALDLLAGGLSAILLPSMSRQYGAGGVRALGGMLVQSTRLYWFVGLAVAGIGLTVADGAIRVLYGDRYVLAIPALSWQLLVSGLLVMNGAALAALTADDRQLARIIIVACGLAFNVVMGYALVPRYGLSGAIASTVISQFFASLLIWTYTLAVTRARLLVGPMARLLLAATLAAGLSWGLTSVWHWAWAFVPGGLLFVCVYLVLSVILRAWLATDFEVFASLASKAGAPGRRLAPRIAALALRYGAKVNAQN